MANPPTVVKGGKLSWMEEAVKLLGFQSHNHPAGNQFK